MPTTWKRGVRDLDRDLRRDSRGPREPNYFQRVRSSVVLSEFRGLASIDARPLPRVEARFLHPFRFSLLPPLLPAPRPLREPGTGAELPGWVPDPSRINRLREGVFSLPGPSSVRSFPASRPRPVASAWQIMEGHTVNRPRRSGYRRGSRRQRLPGVIEFSPPRF
jgi:hypothetical protein